MYTLQKKGKYWHAVFFPRDGKRFQRSTGCTRRDDARKWADRNVSKIAAGRASTTLETAFERLTDYKIAAKFSEATLEVTEQKANRICEFFGNDTAVSEITLARCQDYVSYRRERVSDSTITKEIGQLIQALRNLKRHDLYDRDPTALWPPELNRASGKRQRWLTLDEYRAILEHMGPTTKYERAQPFGPGRKSRRRQVVRHAAGLGDDYREHFRVYCFTGIRASELYRLEGRHYRPRTRELFVAGTKTRGSARMIPVHEEVAGALAARRIGNLGPLFPIKTKIKTAEERFKKKLDRACKLAGVAHTSHNDLRRTFVSWCLHWDIPEQVVVQWMGHGSARMVREVYGQPSAEHGLRWINRLPSICQQTTGKRPKRQGLTTKKSQ